MQTGRGGGDDMDRDDAVEVCVAGNDGSSPSSELTLAPWPCRCRDCLFTRRTLRRDAVDRRPPVLPAGEGTYRLASWWSGGSGPDL